MEHWAPRSRAPMNLDGMFKFSSPSTSVTHPSAMERQRQKDGTPITRGNLTSLQPPDVALIIKGSPKPVDDCAKDDKMDLEKAMDFIKNFMGQ